MKLPLLLLLLATLDAFQAYPNEQVPGPKPPESQVPNASNVAAPLAVNGPTTVAVPTPSPVTATEPPPDCSRECSGDDQCPPDKACTDFRCTDPCPGRCGANSTCRVVNHIPSCECLPGHKGNPLEGCKHQPGGECGKTWPPNGVKKFKAEATHKLNWLEAVLQCKNEGRRLATVKNKCEADAIKKEIRNTWVRSGDFWIGGTDHYINKEWFWFEDNQRIGEFRDWMLGQPDSDGEDCLEYWEANQQIGYKWNDRPCHEQHHYVCEYYEPGEEKCE